MVDEMSDDKAIPWTASASEWHRLPSPASERKGANFSEKLDFWWCLPQKGSVDFLIKWGYRGHWGCRGVKAWKITTEIEWILETFLLEAVDASQCYFFENWLLCLKIYNLRIPKLPSNKIITCVFLSARVNLKGTLQYETPCKTWIELI